jgi:hypothetical protein
MPRNERGGCLSSWTYLDHEVERIKDVRATLFAFFVRVPRLSDLALVVEIRRARFLARTSQSFCFVCRSE